MLFKNSQAHVYELDECEQLCLLSNLNQPFITQFFSCLNVSEWPMLQKDRFEPLSGHENSTLKLLVYFITFCIYLYL